jgi:hypothetical protein
LCAVVLDAATFFRHEIEVDMDKLQGLAVGIVGMSLVSYASGQLYGAGPWTLSSPTPAMYEIDTASGQSVEVGHSGAFFGTSGMTYDGEQILMVTQAQVFSVDQETGVPSLLHTFSDEMIFLEGAVAADPMTGTLYFLNKTTFARMNVQTGDLEIVYDDGVGLDLSGATFDDQGRLWAVYLNGSSSHLAQINPQTGLRTTLDILSLPFANPSVGGMAYDSDEGFLYVVSGSTLVRVDDQANTQVVGNVGVARMSGLVYVPQESECVADFTGEGDLNFLDVSAFLAAYGSLDPIADFEADGSFNFLDVSAFLAAFGAGCP